MTAKHVFQYSQEQLFQVELELSACAHCHMSLYSYRMGSGALCVSGEPNPLFSIPKAMPMEKWNTVIN